MPFQGTQMHDTNPATPDAGADTETGFVLSFDESGVLFEFNDPRLDSLYQNPAQIRDLIAKLQRAIS